MNNVMYYVTGHTGNGFVNYVSSNVENLDHVFVLKHPSLRVKSDIIRRIVTHFESDNDVEILCSSFGSSYLDGCIVREKSFAVLDEITADELKDVHVVQIASAENEQVAASLDEQIRIQLNAVYDHFSSGLKVHDHLEDIFIQQMDFEKADQVAEDFIQQNIQGIQRKEAASVIYHRLFGTNTPDGSVNVIRPLIDELQKSYFIKGRAGTGKSTLMKKIMAACQNLGLNIELYHCSFDPESVDMVLVRELGFCIFDSTDPHEINPQRPNEEIIDMYAATVQSGTDEKFREKIHEVNATYKSFMKQGLAEMKTVGKLLAEKDQLFAVPAAKRKRITADIIERIENSTP